MRNDSIKDIANIEKIKKRFIELARKVRAENNDVLDEALYVKLSDNCFSYEKEFFREVISCLSKYYGELGNIKIIFTDMTSFFNVQAKIDDEVIVYSLFFQNFIILFCTFVLLYYEQMSTDNEESMILYKNFIIAIVDIMAQRKTGVNFNNKDIEWITQSTDISIKASVIARNIQAFIICHEIAHIIFDKNDSKEKIERELRADYEGAIMYRILVEEMPSKYNIHNDYSRAPLIFFDILDFIDYYKGLIINENDSNNTYPENLLRKNALLSQIDFNVANDVNNAFYLIFNDFISEMKYYVYVKKDIIRYNIINIFNEKK